MLRELTPIQKLVDLLIAGGYLLLFVLLPVADGSFRLAPIGAALLLGAALGMRRWSPPFALALAWAAAVVQMTGHQGADPFDAAIPPIVYACAAYGNRSTRWAAFTSSLIGGAVAGVFTARFELVLLVAGSNFAPENTLALFSTVTALTAVTLLLAWTLGVLVRTAQRSQRNRVEADEAGEQVAAEQERTRIARDMHDVVAHSLAVVIAQSDGARMLRRAGPDDAEAVDEALETIGAVSRAALADVRVLLQQLRYEGTTSVQPGLADIDALMAQFRGSGLEVELRRDQDLGPVGTSTQLAAFRIVQESLTNALRHGDLSRPAVVTLTRTPHGLEAEVVSAIDTARPVRASPGGHGLIGMRERASAVLGDLIAGPDGGRFRVRAFLPTSATAAIDLPRGVALPQAIR